MEPLLCSHRWQVTLGAVTAPKHAVVERGCSSYPGIDIHGRRSIAWNGIPVLPWLSQPKTLLQLFDEQHKCKPLEAGCMCVTIIGTYQKEPSAPAHEKFLGLQLSRIPLSVDAHATSLPLKQ
jgi:hypothetical protein